MPIRIRRLSIRMPGLHSRDLGGNPAGSPKQMAASSVPRADILEAGDSHDLARA